MKVNDYVRIETGYIGEIININEFREPSMKYGIEFQGVNDIIFIGDEHIVKSSLNIIDLVEVGDYVNGNKVIDKEDYLLWVFDNEKQDTLYYNEEDIKSIVTKEQFESMECKVGD